MTIMPDKNENDNAVSKCCESFIKRFKINKLLKKANATKEKGLPTYAIFAFLFWLVFSDKNFLTLKNHRNGEGAVRQRCRIPYLKKVVYKLE